MNVLVYNGTATPMPGNQLNGACQHFGHRDEGSIEVILKPA